jgi:hypothetical protein
LDTPDDVHPTNNINSTLISSPRSSTASTNNSTIFYTMQSTASSSSLGTIGTGIVPPPMNSHQPQYMQSTTPSVPNGKDEMRGWLYKWTNVKQNKKPQIFSHQIKFFFFSLVCQRLSKTLVCFTCWYIIILSYTR